jgi:hypothetical protein
VRERIATTDPAIRRLRDQRADARPGRAFFLERQLRDDVETATQQALVTLAQSAFDRLSSFAVDAQLSAVCAASEAANDVEILRAALLVSRDVTGQLQQELRSPTHVNDGLRYECTGPWPPYTFAALDMSAQ